jgi:hypothetical protein
MSGIQKEIHSIEQASGARKENDRADVATTSAAQAVIDLSWLRLD